MKVKCYFAEGPEVDQNMSDLLATARGIRGANGLGALCNDRDGISLSKTRGALVLVGGRDSIHDFLLYQGTEPRITGGRPFLVSFARKHKVFGKNETCLKIVSGAGHRQPADGSEFVALGVKGAAGTLLSLTPPELAHCLHFMYGWG